MDTSKLSPGYVNQQFSLGRSKMYEFADKVEQKNRALGYFAGVGVSVLTFASDMIEIPFKAVEDVALGIINLVGAIFSKGCRKNLKQCGVSLLQDAASIATVAVIVISPIAVPIICGSLIAIGIIAPKRKGTFERKAQVFRNQSLQIDVSRKLGYSAVRGNQTIMEFLKEDPTHQKRRLEALLAD